MTLSTLAEKVAARCTFSLTQAQSKIAIETFLQEIEEALTNGEEVKLHRFGTFQVHQTSPTKKNVPGKGVVNVPSKNRVKFSVAPQILEKLNQIEN